MVRSLMPSIAETVGRGIVIVAAAHRVTVLPGVRCWRSIRYPPQSTTRSVVPVELYDPTRHVGVAA
jgi:hypothetical protein